MLAVIAFKIYIHINNLKYVKFPIIFEKDNPIKPFEQLMIVLPSDSKDLLPNSYAKKMIDLGFQIVTVGSDKIFMNDCGKSIVSKLKS